MQEQDSAIKVYGFCEGLKFYCLEHHEQLAGLWSAAHPQESFKEPKKDPIYGYTQILQWYGTDVVRRHDPDTWVRALAKRLETEKPGSAIIADVRFTNEARFIKEKGGYMVNVRRLNADGSQFLDAGRDPNHPSETALDDYEYDFVIEVRDGDLISLKKKSIGVWNIVNNPTKYVEYFGEHYPRYTSGMPGMMDISELPLSTDIFGLDSDGTGFK